MAPSRKRKDTAGGQGRPPKARKTQAGEEKPQTTGDTASTTTPTHQDVLRGFLLAGQDTSDVEHLLRIGEQQDLRFSRSSRTANNVLRKIQDHFATSYNLSALSTEARKWNPDAPRIRSRWDAINALADWDLQAEQDIKRARSLGDTDLGPLPDNPSREEVQQRLNEEFEVFRHICRERRHEEPCNLGHALDLVEMPALTESISALSLSVPENVGQARELLRLWDIEGRKDLKALGLDPTLIEHEGRPHVWDRIVEADRPLRERALALGYEIHTNTRAYQILGILSTSIIAGNEDELRKLCERASLRTDVDPRELRKRLLNHEETILSILHPGERSSGHPSDAPNSSANPIAGSILEPTGTSTNTVQLTTQSAQVSLPTLELAGDESLEEPSAEAEYLHGLGNEPASVYQQRHPSEVTDTRRLLFDAFAIAFFGDSNEWRRVQQEAQKLFRLALFIPDRLRTGGRNYIRCVRHDWYRELNHRAELQGGASLRDQLWLGCGGTVEMVQVLADVYHVQIVIHVHEDDRWSLLIRGPSQLEGARKQIHLILWKDDHIWTTADRVTPDDSWLSNFSDHPICIMPLIPAPIFTDGIRPVPLIRDATRCREEDYQLEMDDLPPLPADPEGWNIIDAGTDSNSQHSANANEDTNDDDNDVEGLGEGSNRAVEAWRDNVSPAEANVTSQSAEATESRADNEENGAARNLKNGCSRNVNDRVVDIWSREDSVRLPESRNVEPDIGVEKEGQSEMIRTGDELQIKHQMTFGSERSIQEVQTKDGNGNNRDEASVKICPRDQSGDQDTPRSGRPAPSLQQPSAPTPQNPNRPKIPGLDLINDSDEASESGLFLTRPRPVPLQSDLSQSGFLAQWAHGQPSRILNEDPPEALHERISNIPSPERHNRSEYERHRLGDEDEIEGAVYFQGQRIPLYDEDSPRASDDGAVYLQGRRIPLYDEDSLGLSDEGELGNSPGRDERKMAAGTLSGATEASNRRGPTGDLDDPVEEWQNRSQRTQQPMRLSRSPLHRETGCNVETRDRPDPIQSGIEHRSDHTGEADYDSLFDEP
ncbi:MAG: hypothetical protein M1822_009896 [Bathelium mastoideum]|nr:MAG: hypothetical protein M1822_009896 [Bathelium mastoideum]